MKIYNITDIENFLKVVKDCQGKVELISSEGDRLNLKSKLCQYLTLSKLFSASNEEIPELELVCYNPEDALRFVDYLI